MRRGQKNDRDANGGLAVRRGLENERGGLAADAPSFVPPFARAGAGAATSNVQEKTPSCLASMRCTGCAASRRPRRRPSRCRRRHAASTSWRTSSRRGTGRTATTSTATCRSRTWSTLTCPPSRPASSRAMSRASCAAVRFARARVRAQRALGCAHRACLRLRAARACTARMRPVCARSRVLTLAPARRQRRERRALVRQSMAVGRPPAGCLAV